MMKLQDFKENTLTDDIAFKYKDEEYFIFLFGTSFSVGKHGVDEEDKKFNKYENTYENREDMFNNWIIEGKPLKDIVSEIELL